jgi:hypothetical protein
MELIGRERELERVMALIGAAAEGEGGALTLVGRAGSGKSALAGAAAGLARSRGFEVLHAARAAGQPPGLVWAQLLRAAGSDDDLARLVMAGPTALDLDAAAQALASAEPRLIVVDDIPATGVDVDLLAVLTGRLIGSRTAVIATAAAPLGLGPEFRISPISEDDLAALLPSLSTEEIRALHVASRGLPGAALALAAGLSDLAGADPGVHLALSATSTTQFLSVDWAMVRQLEAAIDRVVDDRTLARLQAKLASELLGDSTSVARRRELVDAALAAARRSGDRQVLAVVLAARLHALWGPTAAEDRLAAASEIIDLAAAVNDEARQRQGLFWRFIALMELSRVDEAETALAAFAFAAADAGDTAASVMVVARHAMLAILRGRFDEAERLVSDVAEMGRRIGLPDAEALVATLHGGLSLTRAQTPPRTSVEVLLAAARDAPGHLYEATAAVILALRGELAEAQSELDRLLPGALTASGPRWLAAMLDLADTAALVGDREASSELYRTLLPYGGRLAVFGGANMCRGTVAQALGLLAGALGDLDGAVGHLRAAALQEERIGALPFLARTSAELAAVLQRRGQADDLDEAAKSRARAWALAEQLGLIGLLDQLEPAPDEWVLKRVGEDWLLTAGPESVRLRDSRGLHYLQALLAADGQEIPALDLLAGGPGLAARSMGPVLDDAARAAYRARLNALTAELAEADAVGDPTAAARLEGEREALLDELRQATGLGGRTRYSSPEAERARVNATRSIRAALLRIAAGAPAAGAHLQASIRTGGACRYAPGPGGPQRWRV